jgi:hypothetical protein
MSKLYNLLQFNRSLLLFITFVAYLKFFIPISIQTNSSSVFSFNSFNHFDRFSKVFLLVKSKTIKAPDAPL